MDSKPTYLENIGSRIKELRLKRNMNQAEIAQLAKISLPQYSNIELGKADPRLGNFIKIAQVLNVSADEILLMNTPKAMEVSMNEYAELLSDCTPAEIESINKIVKEIKVLLHHG